MNTLATLDTQPYTPQIADTLSMLIKKFSMAVYICPCHSLTSSQLTLPPPRVSKSAFHIANKSFHCYFFCNKLHLQIIFGENDIFTTLTLRTQLFFSFIDCFLHTSESFIMCKFLYVFDKCIFKKYIPSSLFSHVLYLNMEMLIFQYYCSQPSY